MPASINRAIIRSPRPPPLNLIVARYHADRRATRYGTDKLVSRSQAKRVLARVELFKTVVFDFKGVDYIGQAFSDEIFRVFANAHPDIKLLPIHANSEVKRMIARARSGTVMAPESGKVAIDEQTVGGGKKQEQK